MVWELVVKWAVPFLLGAIAAGIGTWFGVRRKQTKAMRAGMQALLRAEILRSYEKYMEKGFCPLYAREALAREYTAYHDLGGNDVATDLYHQICELPTERRES